MHPPTLPTYLPTTLLLLLTPILASNPQQTSLLTCNQDNQLRALERFSTQASTFCPSYLSPLTTTTTAAGLLPTYVSDFQSADVSSACACFQASATETVLTLSGTPAPTSIPTASVTPEPTAAVRNGGLSTGAKAGIAIACVIVAVACILGVVMLFRRKWRMLRRGDGGKGARVSRGDEGVGPPAYDAVEKDAGGYNFEVEGGNRFELQGGRGVGGERGVVVGGREGG